MTDPVRKGYADTPSGQIHYRRVEGSGVPLILLHRTPVDSHSFDAMLRLFAGKRAAIALDTPGFGQSFQPLGAPGAVDYAGWLLAALDGLNIDAFHLCGHHTGMHFATEIALLAPGRVRSLILSGVLYAEPAERVAIRQEIGLAPPIDEDGRYVTDTWRLMKSLFPTFEPNTVHAEFVAALASPQGRNQAFDAVLSQDFAAALARVTRPVRIIQPCDDPLTAFLDRVRAAHPDIPVDLLDGGGIAAPELRPNEFAARVIEFAAAND